MTTTTSPPCLGEMLQIKEHLNFIERDIQERVRLITAVREAVDALPAAEVEGYDASIRALSRAEQAYNTLKSHLHPEISAGVYDRADKVGWSFKAYGQMLTRKRQEIEKQKIEAQREAQRQRTMEASERAEFERFQELQKKYGAEQARRERAGTAYEDMHF